MNTLIHVAVVIFVVLGAVVVGTLIGKRTTNKTELSQSTHSNFLKALIIFY